MGRQWHIQGRLVSDRAGGSSASSDLLTPPGSEVFAEAKLKSVVRAAPPLADDGAKAQRQLSSEFVITAELFLQGVADCCLVQALTAGRPQDRGQLAGELM